LAKAILIEGITQPHKIVGVCRNPPVNSHLQFKIVSTWKGLLDLDGLTMLNNQYYTYSKLKSSKYDDVERSLNKLLEKDLAEAFQKLRGKDFKTFRAEGGMESPFAK